MLVVVRGACQGQMVPWRVQHIRGITLVLALCLFVAGCGVPHVAPLPRPQNLAEKTVVRVYSTCTEEAPFKTGEPGDPHVFDPDIVWRPDYEGTGVVISEMHVLTAAHVVFCPTIPGVTVTFPDGRWQMMQVERDDAMFGSGTDIARLEMASADRFHLNIAPPQLENGGIGDVYCAQTLHGRTCGTRGYPKTVIENLHTYPGDSGSPVYNDVGQLAGLVTAGGTFTDGTYFTRIVEIGPTWLEGT